MKHVVSILLLFTFISEAQAPHTFSYQTVIRDSNWQPRANETINISAIYLRIVPLISLFIEKSIFPSQQMQ